MTDPIDQLNLSPEVAASLKSIKAEVEAAYLERIHELEARDVTRQLELERLRLAVGALPSLSTGDVSAHASVLPPTTGRRVACVDCGAHGFEPIMHYPECKPAPVNRPGLWRGSDPRTHFNKRGTIIIQDGAHSTIAHVESNHGWHVSLHEMVSGRTFIGENDSWPEHWEWIEMPRREQSIDVGPRVWEVGAKRAAPYRFQLQGTTLGYWDPLKPGGKVEVLSMLELEPTKKLLHAIREACLHIEKLRMTVEKVTLDFNVANDLTITAWPPAEYRSSVAPASVIVKQADIPLG